MSIVIVGSGFSGLGMAIRLKQSGIDDFVVLERASGLGGTWRDNTYPGCACDVESHLYSYSFAPNPKWSQMWSPQAEILNYLKNCARKFGIESHLKFNCDFQGASWDESKKKWIIQTSQGELESSALISAMGALVEPALPHIKGIESFQGKIFHSARWDHGYDLEGKRVAVIGTGASAIQFVPAIAPKVKQLHLFQRTAAWIIPHPNRPLTAREHRWFERFPFLQKLWRLRIYLMHELSGLTFRHPKLSGIMKHLSSRYLERKVKDPELRKKLTPNYTIGCKRVLVSRQYFPAVQRENVELVTEPIESIHATGVKTQDGKSREVDAIILGTGFNLEEIHGVKKIRGREGKSLWEIWGPSPRAHLGTTVSGFPNLFFIFGPNTGLGHNSVMLMAEAQMNHVVATLLYMRRKNALSIEPKPEAQATFSEYVDQRMKRTVWMTGCKSWYLDSTGRNSTLWPYSVGKFRRRLRGFRPGEYLIHSNP